MHNLDRAGSLMAVDVCALKGDLWRAGDTKRKARLFALGGHRLKTAGTETHGSVTSI